MGSNVRSGTFQAKLGAARKFALVTTVRRDIQITPLGVQAIGEDGTAARAQAFLEVPLYSGLFAAYRSGPLPGDTGLESKIASLGVPQKQVRTARQVFMRSARQAGFFDVAPDRLVEPPTGGGRKPAEPLVDDGSSAAPAKPAIGDKPALVLDLFRKLPNAQGKLSVAERARWMAALNASLDLEYPDSVVEETTVRPPSGLPRNENPEAG